MPLSDRQRIPPSAQAAQAITTDLRHHRQILDTIIDLVLVKGPESRIVWANRSFQSFYGMSNEQLRDMLDAPATPPDYTQQYIKDDLYVFTTGRVLDIPREPVRRHDGKILYFHTVKSPLFDEQGRVVMTVGVSRDITERIAAEERAARANRETDMMLSALSAILIGIDAEGLITRWNHAADRAFGTSAGWAIGQPWKIVCASIEVDKVVRACARVRETRSDLWLDDVRHVRRDGSDGYLSMNINANQTVGSAVDGGFIILATDITERRILEAQRSHGQKLESVGQLAAGVAHEINTPLQFVGDNLQFLQEGFATICGSLTSRPVAQGDGPEVLRKADDVAYLTTEIPKALEQSIDGVKRVADIVDALKAFSHPNQQGRKDIDIREPLTSALVLARGEYKLCADAVTDFPADLPLVPCQVSEIAQVFLNIVVNAAHAIADRVADGGGRGTIAISAKTIPGAVEIRISDTGRGIPIAIQHKIFNPFFTTRDVGHGTGQGLFIARAIIQRHQGSITFETIEDRGTTFIIRLPLG